MADGFRIGRVTVEGFKGFTTRQELELQNRHVFLLGRNGNGKSSVVEAIRWGLFGSTNRQNDIIANRKYPSRCRVEIGLLRNGREWHLRRTLIRGASGGSDARLFDDSGEERHIREIMPQLDSLDAGEGTHIIFAPQAAPLKRRPEDLSPFERTVFNHLGLTHAQALLKHLEASQADLSQDEGELDEQLSGMRKRVDEQIAALLSERGRTLKSPPWGDGKTPTLSESESKATAFIETIRGSGQGAVNGLSLWALVEQAEEGLSDRSASERGALQEELSEAEERQRQLESASNTLRQLKENLCDVATAESRTAELLEDSSLDAFRRSVDMKRRAVKALALKRQVAAISMELLRRESVGDSAPCPVCGVEQDRKVLTSTVQVEADSSNEEELLDLTRAESALEEVDALLAEMTNKRQEADDLRQAFDTTLAGITDIAVDGADHVADAVLKAEHDTVSEKIKSVTAQLDDRQGWVDELATDLSALRAEARYHDMQRELREFRAIETDFQRVERAYRDLVAFGESVRHIQDAVASTLTEELRSRAPMVARDLTRVFAALTRHPYFDRLILDEGKLPRLELCVSSSQFPDETHPTGVLNGQAQSALDLVPYFALGQAHEAPTEVYLVLLDDPTRAFDQEHIEILVKSLSDLGKSVQLVVASQEAEVFRALLKTSFDRNDYVVIEPQGWSIEDGPQLAVEYE